MTNSKTELNDFVASFRIPTVLKKQIEDHLKLHPVIGCKSANQYMRKLAIDRFTRTNGGTLLAYANPEDDKQSPELAAAKRQLQAVQSPAKAGLS